MKYRTGIYGFLAIYLLIIIVSFSGNWFIFQDLSSNSNNGQLWLYSISQATLTQFNSGLNFSSQTSGFHLFSAFITQITSLLFHSLLLWSCWQLFGSSRERAYTIRRSFGTASLVVVICQLILFAFFLYAIPLELVQLDLTKKVLAAITLSVNSFNNAGFSNGSYFFDPEVLSGNFMIQVGVIEGTVLGSLGLFVIIDLFSPVKLRQRLANPSIDWTFATKISVFGAATILTTYVIAYVLLGDPEVLAEKNILESLSFILMEGVSARGFGPGIIDLLNSPAELLNTSLAFFGAGPFSTGGGASLLFFVFLYSLLSGKNQRSTQINIGFKIIQTWLIISTVVFVALFSIIFIAQISISASDLFYLYTNNHLETSHDENLISGIIKTVGLIVGRCSFIASCIILINKNASGTI